MSTLALPQARIPFGWAIVDGRRVPVEIDQEWLRALSVLVDRAGGVSGNDDFGIDVFSTGQPASDFPVYDVAQAEAQITESPVDIVQPMASEAMVPDLVQPVVVESFMPDVVQPANEAPTFNLASTVHAATSKATPVDADELPLADSASSFTLKKLTWANLKATLAAWIGGNHIAAKFTSLGVNTASIIAGMQAQVKTISSANYSTTFTIGATPAAALLYDGSVSASFPNCCSTLLFGAGDLGGAWGAISNIRVAAQSSEMSIMLSNGSANPTEAFRFSPTGFKIPGGLLLLSTGAALSNYANTGAGTITNAPVSGNPTKWIGINDNGTTRYIPVW